MYHNIVYFPVILPQRKLFFHFIVDQAAKRESFQRRCNPSILSFKTINIAIKLAEKKRKERVTKKSCSIWRNNRIGVEQLSNFQIQWQQMHFDKLFSGFLHLNELRSFKQNFCVYPFLIPDRFHYNNFQIGPEA